MNKEQTNTHKKCVSLRQMSRWIGQLTHCTTPKEPNDWEDILHAIGCSNYTFLGVHVIYEPINLRKVLWKITKDHPLVTMALKDMEDKKSFSCTFLVKDTSFSGQHGLFLVECHKTRIPEDYTKTIYHWHDRCGIIGYVQLDKTHGITLHAEQCKEVMP